MGPSRPKQWSGPDMAMFSPLIKALAGAGIEMIAIDNRERLLKTALDALSGIL